MNVAAGQESKVIWTGTPEEIYNGVESLRYGLILDDGKSTGAIKKGVILAVIRDYDIESGSLLPPI